MKIINSVAAIAALASTGLTNAAVSSKRFSPHHPGTNAEALHKRQSDENPYPVYSIQQPINHFPDSSRYEPHSNDTFAQRYIFDDSFYQPGGPVYLYIGGETSLESRVDNLQTGIIRLLMEATSGLGIILENRYYGESYPFNSSTTDELRFLTMEQAIADNAFFAQHANFPGVQGNESLRSPHSPWILYGGSLAGAQTAFSLHEYGDGDEAMEKGVLWGGIASSGTTHAMLAYPQWYAPIQKFAPQDCVASINGIVEKMNEIFDSGDRQAITRMKMTFGLEDLIDADFAQAVAFPIGGPFTYPTNTWQELNWKPEDASDDFWLFCNNVTNLDASHNTTQIDYTLSQYTNGQPWTNLGNWANYIKSYVIPLCDGAPINSTDCFSTQNQSYWADTTNSATRSYLYQTCTEYGLYQVAPKHFPALIANPLQVEYTQQWCDWAFPAGDHNSIPTTPDLERVNKYGGLNVTAPRLAKIDGNIDPWLDICYHSNLAPERVSVSMEEEALHPQLLIAGSGHHWDSYALGSVAKIQEEPQFIRMAHEFEIRTVRRWIDDWQKMHSDGTGWTT